MSLHQPKRKQANNGWSKTDSKYEFAPTKEKPRKKWLEQNG